jgi:hypothetical protein
MTLINTMLKNISIQLLATGFLFSSSSLIIPAKANAMTGEEFIKLIGVVYRTAIDINKTFGTGSQPPPVEIQPEVPDPNYGTDNSQPEPENTEEVEEVEWN